MFRTLERIKALPVAHRRRIAFLIALVATVIIGSMWARSLVAPTVEVSQAATAESPFRTLWEQVGEVVKGLRQLR